MTALLAQVGTGDQIAFDALYALTHRKIKMVCGSVCIAPVLAEEAMQETFLLIWRNAARFRPELGSPISWITAIARNRSIDILRVRRPNSFVPVDAAMEIVDSAPTPEAAAICADEVRHLRSRLAMLPVFQRELIQETFLAGKTYDALASIKGVPIGTMKSWMRRALLRLRADMGPGDYESGSTSSSKINQLVAPVVAIKMIPQSKS